MKTYHFFVLFLVLFFWLFREAGRRRKNYELKILAKIPNLYEVLKLKNFNFCFFTVCFLGVG